MPKITRAEAIDVRFPTSTMLDGSDAMNADPDYSAAYLRLHTDDPTLVGTSFVSVSYTHLTLPTNREV